MGGHQDEVQGCYIMTLGVIDEVRKLGIGTILLEKLYRQIAYNYPECGIIYLHVVSYNDSAIKFYKEKNDFKFLRTVQDHYEIFGKEYNAEIYYKIFDVEQYLPNEYVEF